MAVARHVSIPKLKPIQLLVLANMYLGQAAAQESAPNGGWFINENVRNAIFLAYGKHPVEEITELVAAGIIEAVVPGTAPNVPADAIRISASVMEQWIVIKRQIRAVPANDWPPRRPYQAETSTRATGTVVPFTAASFDPMADDEPAAASVPAAEPEPAEVVKTRAGRARDAVNAKLRGSINRADDAATKADIARITGQGD